MTMTPEITVLRVDASGRHEGSQTRALTDKLVAHLRTREVDRVMTRDLAGGVEFVDEAWINANFTPEEDRTAEQKLRLRASDGLVDELVQSDVVVIATPIYNFGVPAALKAWVDQVARARKTFRYTDNGPVGLLEGKKAYIVITSGGTKVGSDIDFATGYLKHVLGFIGIDDVTVFAADQLMMHGNAGVALAENAIDAHFASQASRAA
ncbi:MAG: FMN-dependent NADH-azoreductase [Hyphomicrobiaceae bacterium]